MLARSSAVRAAIASAGLLAGQGSVMAGRYLLGAGHDEGRGAPLRSPPFRWVVRSALPAP